MCRILGILNYQNLSDSSAKNLINSLTDELAHGGPDDRGIYQDKDNKVVLGHRRLSILDLSKSGNQPMSNENESILIVFNGEIYNYLELRKELIGLGHIFKSNTDTEVILKSYIQWGVNSFEKFIGMFSFCIYDKISKNTYLVRDQSGIKPLYYSFDKNQLIFSSETKTFSHYKKDWKENNKWKTYFLAFGFIPEPFTSLENVLMLPKGSYLVFNNKSFDYNIIQYDKYDFTSTVNSLEEATYNIERLIEKSVKRHLISDAPIGVFLSGGIDSSLISLLSSKFLGSDLNTLSITFDESEYSEKKFQKIVQKKINSNHSSYQLHEKDFLNSVENIFSVMDQPTTDGINTYFISKFAHEDGLKTVLSGLGGDELFGGYPSFDRINKIWFLNKVNRSFRKIFSVFDYLGDDKIKKLSYLSMKSPHNFYLLFRAIHNTKSISRVLEIDQREVLKSLEDIPMMNIDSLEMRNAASLMESDIYMKNQLLRDTDFMSMSNSVEVRVPFLDQELVKYIYSIDPEVKFAGNNKYLLQKTFENLIPKEILNRKKQGFLFPFQLWIKKNINMFSDLIKVKNPMVDNMIEDFKSGKLHWSRFWSLVVLSQKSAI